LKYIAAHPWAYLFAFSQIAALWIKETISIE